MTPPHRARPSQPDGRSRREPSSRLFPRPAPSEPAAVHTAFLLWLGALALLLVTHVLATLSPPTPESWTAYFVDSGVSPDVAAQAGSTAAAGGAGWRGVAATVVLVVLLGWVATVMRSGATWAVWATGVAATLLVLGTALGAVLLTATSFPGPTDGLAVAAGAAAGVLALGSLLALFGRASRRWYVEHARQ